MCSFGESLSEEQLKTEGIYRKESKKEKRTEELRLKYWNTKKVLRAMIITTTKKAKSDSRKLKMWNCHEIVGTVKKTYSDFTAR